jgi:hypothetical protein
MTDQTLMMRQGVAAPTTPTTPTAPSTERRLAVPELPRLDEFKKAVTETLNRPERGKQFFEMAA